MAAPQPIPTALKLITGNRGKRPLNQDEPKPKRVIPKAPLTLSKVGKKAWAEFTRLLDDMDILTEADATGVERMCEAYARVLECQDAMNKYGLILEYIDPNTGDIMLKANPAAAALAKAEMLLKAYLAEFGLTPSSRSKVKTNGAQKPKTTEKYFD